MANPLKHLERYAPLIDDFDAFAEAVHRPTPLHARVNTLKARIEDVVRVLSSLGIDARPEPWCPELLRLEGAGERRLGSTFLHTMGHYYLQSASSAVAAVALDARPGQEVLDLCASPGSKTTLLAQRMRGEGVVVANEPSRKRLTPLQDNLRRMGVLNAVVTSYDGEMFPLRRRFDRILVDAPCSGEGTWRGPEARPRPITESARERLAQLQAQLLERAVELLAPGGEIVYSTCTYAPEENELVVGPVAERHGLSILPLGLDLPACPGLTQWEGKNLSPALAATARLYPHRFDSEGFFVARLAR
jgi:NOL1/NOP2/sun family putative RNA methylase